LRILISLFDTLGVEKVARIFQELDWEILCSKETLEVLNKVGISAKSVEDFTGAKEDFGFPPTLHPKIEAGLTSDISNLKIDIVYDIPYPNSQGNDVGGHTLLGLAAKGKRIPVTSQEDMQKVITELKKFDRVSDDLRGLLITKANALIANHYLSLIRSNSPPGEGLIGTHSKRLLNGENPYQSICHSFTNIANEDSLALNRFKQISGELPCFTNLADLDCILHSLCLACEAFRIRFGSAPFLAVASKHGNPCGFAADWNAPSEALRKALWGNPFAIWGGELICNFDIDSHLGEKLFEDSDRQRDLGNGKWMLDVIAAPSFSDNAQQLLSKRKQRKLFTNKNLLNPVLNTDSLSFRQIRGGFLTQTPLDYILDFNNVESKVKEIGDDHLSSIILAWATAWSSNLGGNEVALVKDLQLIGLGGGPATTISIKSAFLRAQEQNHDTRSSVFASDAFFPFVDGPEILTEKGCEWGLVPQGGIREKEIREHFEKQGVRMFYIPEQFRGFCRH
jgi:phosphoribosylaminoimidazolecarboxamide formyltransferase / IMP cyclohydrolase